MKSVATDFPTGIVTLVFTDIEGSSDLAERHRADYHRSLQEHNRIIRATAERWHGVEVKTIGDAFMLAFHKASDAVCWALEAQRALTQFAWPAPPGELRVRIGMHTGEPRCDRHPDGKWDYFGPPVNRAARVEAAAHGRQILISDATHNLAAPELPPEITFDDHGLHRLKGVGEDRLWQLRHPELPSAFPPLATLNPQRHNLPLPSTPFIGRDEWVAEWCDFLRKTSLRLLTLLGFGGMGKTRAALHLAELCADDFNHGVWWVDLEETRTADEMFSRLAHHLSLHLQPQASVKQQVLSFLRERKKLLVLDNMEQIVDGAAGVSELLNATRDLKCLVTSRRALELQLEQIVEVPPLPGSDAEALFVERARARKPGFAVTVDNAADVSELCRRLEGVPLAIELAASRVIGMAPREVLQRLDQQFQVLQMRAPDLRPRQRALRAAIDWSYELLGEEDQNLFAQLSVFVNGFMLEDAEAVCDTPDVFEGVMELRRHSLLRSEADAVTQATRYSMLESVRSYAEEKLKAVGEPARATLREQHATRFVAVAEACIEKQRTRAEAEALRRFQMEFGNVRAAIKWAQQVGQPTTCARLALPLAIALQRLGYFAEAGQAIETGLQAAPPGPDDGAFLRAQLLREQAGLYLDLHQLEAARTAGADTLRLFEELDDSRGQGQAENLLGLIAKRRGDFEPARQHLRAALAHFRTATDHRGLSIARINLGTVEYDDATGDLAESNRQLQEGLAGARENGDDRGTAEALNNLGVLAQKQMQLEEAWKWYQEALGLQRKLRNSYGATLALTNLGEIAELKGDPTLAARLFAAAQSLFNLIGSPYEHYAADKLRHVVAGLEPPDGKERLRDIPLDEVIDWALAESGEGVTG